MWWIFISPSAFPLKFNILVLIAECDASPPLLGHFLMSVALKKGREPFYIKPIIINGIRIET